MSLSPGPRLGSYEVTAALGAGGMGEVYLARDTRLNRDVAIKVLPEAFATDADRLARFTREVKVLDFGLAKAMQPGVGRGLSRAGNGAAEATPYESPTMTSPAMTAMVGDLQRGRQQPDRL